MTLKIAYLVQQFPPEVGAGPARVSEMALRWTAAGAKVSVFTALPNRPAGVIPPEYRGRLHVREEWNGIEVHRSWLYATPNPGFARTVANNLSFMATGGATAALRARGADVLIASSPPFFVHLAGEAARRALRLPLVLEVRDLWPDYLVGMGKVKGRSARALLGLERALLHRAAHVVVVTDTFRRRMAEKGVDPSRVSVIPNAVDDALYYRSDEAPPFPEMAASDGRLVVGYLGNFGASQDLPAVVDAAARLDAEGVPVRVVLAGDGTERDRVMRRVETARPANLTVHGSIPKTDTRAFYGACDIFIVPLAGVPQLQDTIPSKLFEVMACETPVVVAAAGEAARVVNEAGCGVVAAPGDAASIAAAVKQLAALSPERRAEMGRAGRAYVREHYNRGVLAGRYLELLGRVAAGRGVPAALPATPNAVEGR
ncbi:MAG TPA: glycosyltransferase family 4 protein [Longimicrobium sp.]|nr:glycosyltransferase family 4 protein [Longimicrobium sp.]